jgi:hypothetical protein
MVIVDVETFPIHDADQYITRPVVPMPDLDSIKADGRLTDQVKIAADIAKKREAAVAGYEAALLRADADYEDQWHACSVDPDLCCIVAIGYAYHDTDRVECHVCRTEEDERMGLESFWRNTRGHLYVSFGGNQFDLRVLKRRSLYLGVKHPNVNVDRYRSEHRDMQAILTDNGATQPKGKSVSFYCSRFNIENDDPIMGEDIAGLVKAGDWASVESHCRSDVAKEKQLAQRLGLIESRTTGMALHGAEGAF